MSTSLALKDGPFTVPIVGPLARKFMVSRIESQLDRFRPHVRFTVENRRYLLKMAENGEDMRNILRLRHAVFYEELLEKRHPLGLDLDRFDMRCDHLMIIEQATGRCVGTYRFNCSLFTGEFYTATEFDIAEIRQLPGIKVELGRACVAFNHRNGVAITMLWKGIVEYARHTGARWLFGCSSVRTMEVDDIVALHGYFSSYHAGNGVVRAQPHRKFRIRQFGDYCRFITSIGGVDEERAEKLVPPLLRSYLKAGAIILGEPIIDRHFKCTDFLTLLDMEKLNAQVGSRFERDRPGIAESRAA